jgi:hypothetical protein
MAAKKRKKSKKSKKEEDKNSSSFWRGFGAVILIIGGIVLAFGSFVDAPIPRGMWNGSWWLVGAATVIAPFALVYLGSLKFLSEDQRIPLPKIIGVASLFTFFSSWLHVAFLNDLQVGISQTAGYGGNLGSLVGGALIGAFGKFLASLVFFVLTIFSALFTLAIEPRSLLKLLEIFKREKAEGEEDLAELKKKIPAFHLHEGVPVEHHGPQSAARLSSLRNSALKLSPDQDHAALTTARDPDWQFPPLSLLSNKQDKADAGDVQGNAEIIKETFYLFQFQYRSRSRGCKCWSSRNAVHPEASDRCQIDQDDGPGK